MPHPKAANLSGLLTAILTPFDAQGNLALELMPAFLDFQRQAGIDGVVVCGTNGEGTSLSVEERKQVLEAVMAHRNGLIVIAGTGAASITDALELTRHAAEVGADATLALPPFFFKSPSAEGLVAYYRRLLDSADLPLLLYSIPQQTAVPITNEVIDPLLSHPYFAGLKDSAGDWTRTHELLTRYSQLSVFPGSDLLAAKGWTHGAVGCISGGANSFPEVIAAVRDAHRADPTGAKAEEAQTHINALAEIILRYPLLATNKSILAHRGLPRTYVRPPLVDLTPAQEERLLSELRDARFL